MIYCISIQIIITQIIKNIIEIVEDLSLLHNWEKILRSAIFIELLDRRKTFTDANIKQKIEIIAVEILNKINSISDNTTYKFYFNELYYIFALCLTVISVAFGTSILYFSHKKSIIISFNKL